MSSQLVNENASDQSGKVTVALLEEDWTTNEHIIKLVVFKMNKQKGCIMGGKGCSGQHCVFVPALSSPRCSGGNTAA